MLHIDKLKNIQLAFFDYDRTMYDHDYPSFPSLGWRHNSYYEDCLQNLIPKTQEALFERDTPLPCTIWLAEQLKNNGAKLYVLTQEIFNLRDEWKKQHALKDFGIGNYLSVDTAAHKLDMIRAVATVNSIKLSHCLLLDDNLSTIYDAAEAGIHAVHLSALAAAYEHTILK